MEKNEKETEPTLEEDLITELTANDIPEPEKIIEEFDLLSINDDATYLAQEVAKKVKERIVTFAHLLEDLLQPDAGLASMNECSFFDEEEHKKLVASYRELMAIIRQFTAADLEGKEEAYRAFYTAALPAWKGEKAWLTAVAKRLHDGWKRQQTLQHDGGYFG